MTRAFLWFVMVATLGNAGCGARMTWEETNVTACEPGMYAADGLWISTVESKALTPNFTVEANGGQWVFPLVVPPWGRTTSIEVMLSQETSTPDSAAVVSMSRYNNMEGWGTVGPSTKDTPDVETHFVLLDVSDIEFESTDTTRVVIQAPTHSSPADGAMWVWSVPLLEVECD